MSMSFREHLSSLKKRVPENDGEHWALALIFALGLLIYVIITR